MDDLDRLAAMVAMTPDGTMDAPMVRRRLAALAPELIAVAKALRATRNDGACPEERCPCYVGMGDDPHPCTLCGAMRALDVKLAEVFSRE